MGKEIDWVRQEPTGRLIYRRRFPADVQRATGKWELKVSPGVRWRMTPAASQAYFSACGRFDARVALRLQAKELAATFDRLTESDVEYLAGVLIHEQRTGMEQRLRQGTGDLAGAGWAWLLPQLRNIRVNGDAALLEENLGPTLEGLLAAEGFRVDPTDQEERLGLLWALNAKLVSAGDDIGSTIAERRKVRGTPNLLRKSAPQRAASRRRCAASLTAAFPTGRLTSSRS